MPNPGQYPQGNYPAPPSPHMQHYKPGAVNGPAPNAVGAPVRPLNHLKQHLLHKSGYAQSPTSPQSFVNGPAMHPMGPPPMQGPMNSHPRMQVCLSQLHLLFFFREQRTNQYFVYCIFSQRFLAQWDLHSHHTTIHKRDIRAVSVFEIECSPEKPDIFLISFFFPYFRAVGPPPPEDNGLSASGPNAMSQHPVTSIVTTGPDGSNIDEASQQSTISNASAGMPTKQSTSSMNSVESHQQNTNHFMFYCHICSF